MRECMHMHCEHCRNKSDQVLLVVNPWADHLAGAGFALRCWLCRASADGMIGHVYGALLLAVLVVR